MPPPSEESEIEIVTEFKTDLNSAPPNGVETTVIIADAFSASAYGNLEKLRKFVEEDGVPLSKPDANGYYALQWASLNNYPLVAQYIIEHGGDANVADGTRQTALHWAAVRGSIPVADVLLQNGARVEGADVNGYRAVHVAAQYGQTAFLNHIIVQYDADFDATDNDGRSPLHWAAYKGFSGTIRLLLFRDAHQGRQDKEGFKSVLELLELRPGCTPLHWAAIRGNVEACTVLVHAGTRHELLVKDKAGFTPAQLASDKGHRHVAFFLTNVRRMHGSHCEDQFCFGRIGKAGYAPILLFVILILIVLFINSVILSPNFPRVTAVVGLWGWTAVSLAIGLLLMFYRCSSKDPGYIKKSSGGSEKQAHSDDPLLSIDLNNSPVWTGNWSQLCPTCKIIRPVRSKHCPSCRHCVEQFDHHCPWISNCVGKKNKWDFFVFLCMGTLTSFVGAVVAVQRLWSEPQIPFAGSWLHHVLAKHPGAISFLVMDFICLFAATVLTVVQASQIARNITTNEVANAGRYGYLRGPEGWFRNPYNHGFRKNCTDFLIQGYSNDDELAWPSLQ